MFSFKSSPLLQQSSKSKRSSKRDSNRNSKEFDYKVPNPFRIGQEQNILPYDLRQQVQQMQYISTNSIKDMHFPQSQQAQRRSSNFARHLHMMQNAVRKQDQKYQGLVSKKQKKKVRIHQQMMIEQQVPMNMSQMDNLSIQMSNCMNEIDYRDLENQCLFDQVYDNQQIIFYSQHQIQPQIMDDFDSYFNT